MALSVSRPGSANGGADAKALFLKRYAGEVLTAFTKATKFKERHLIRTIDSGKSAQFPNMGRAEARYHTVGNELTGQTIGGNERVISINDRLVSDVFVSDLDLAMSQFEVRREYSKQAGLSLAYAYDKNVARVGIQAARAASNITGMPGGSKIVAATAKTDADVLIEAIFASIAALAGKDVPTDQVSVFLRPDQYFLIVNSGSKAVHKDYGGSGSVAEGVVHRIAGAEIVMSNQLPNTDESLDTSVWADYRGNFSTVAGLVMQRGAVGTVELMGLGLREDYIPKELGHLIVASMAVGHGILRPECAVSIETA